MAILENQRHELFAQELAKGETAHQAYINAGFRASRAARLKANESVAARVTEIASAAAASAEITLASVLRDLDQAIEIARTKGQPNALVNAAALRAKLGGLLIDKTQAEVKVSDSRADSDFVKMRAGEILADTRDRYGEQVMLAIADIFGIDLSEIEVRHAWEGVQQPKLINAKPTKS
jgi:hypothetical protein